MKLHARGRQIIARLVIQIEWTPPKERSIGGLEYGTQTDYTFMDDGNILRKQQIIVEDKYRHNGKRRIDLGWHAYKNLKPEIKKQGKDVVRAKMLELSAIALKNIETKPPPEGALRTVQYKTT